MSNYDTTTEKDSRLVTGLFRDRDSAERAYNSLTDRGYSKDDVTLMMSDDTRKTHFNDTETELGSKAAEGAGVGAGIETSAQVGVDHRAVAGQLRRFLQNPGAIAVGDRVAARVAAGLEEQPAVVTLQRALHAGEACSGRGVGCTVERRLAAGEQR